jgi:hypothetical protein
MLKGVTTWIADAVTGKSGSPFRADMMTWQARFGLDVVRHAEALDWCSGICLDGPLAGKPVYALNRMGSKVRLARPSRLGGGSGQYEVTRVSDEGIPADLRFVRD